MAFQSLLVSTPCLTHAPPGLLTRLGPPRQAEPTGPTSRALVEMLGEAGGPTLLPNPPFGVMQAFETFGRKK